MGRSLTMFSNTPQLLLHPIISCRNVFEKTKQTKIAQDNQWHTTVTIQARLILPLLASWYTWALPISTPNRLRKRSDGQFHAINTQWKSSLQNKRQKRGRRHHRGPLIRNDDSRQCCFDNKMSQRCVVVSPSRHRTQCRIRWRLFAFWKAATELSPEDAVST